MRVGTLGELLKEAYKKEGQPLPISKKEPKALQKKYRTSSAKDAHNKKKRSHSTAHKKKNSQQNRKLTDIENLLLNIDAAPKDFNIDVIQEAYSSAFNKKESLVSPTRVKQQLAEAVQKISIEEDARFTWSSITKRVTPLHHQVNGKEIQINQSSDEKEVFLGLDFGTSTLKAVINDNDRNKAYTVPFFDQIGIGQYLLPCRVYKDNDSYNLQGTGQVYQDLKLSLLDTPNCSDTLHNAIAYIALALKKIRAWFLTEHGDTYSGQLIWSVGIGLPVTYIEDSDLPITDTFNKALLSAWILSTKEITSTETITQSLVRAEEIIQNPNVQMLEDNEDIEIKVFPEMAAQVNGFVSSEAYDPNAKNIYLMADIGAGTLDATVFRIKKEKVDGKNTVSLFTNTVEPYGVMNLHKKRINWLLSVFNEHAPEKENIIKSMVAAKNITDDVNGLPNNVNEYFSGVTLEPRDDIDTNFYVNAKYQIAQDTYVKTLKTKLLDKTDMPMDFILCGGGSRWNLYKKLIKDLEKDPSYSWFRLTHKPLQKPRNLEAKGLSDNDYDRLSVAYGLSRLNNVTVLPVPPLPMEDNGENYRSNYVSASDV